MFIVLVLYPPESDVFASICTARPVPMQSDQYRSCSTVKRHGGCRSVGPDGGQPKTALWLWVREMTWYLYTRWVCGRMKAKQHWFKITVSWMVSPCSASCSWRPLHWGIRHSDLTSRQFHSLVPWWRPRRIRPQKTRLSQLENSAMGKWPKTIMPVRKMAKMAYKILLYVLILKFLKLRCVSLIDDGEYTQNELGMGN